MELALGSLGKAQDDFRQTIAVHANELKAQFDAVQREHANSVTKTANDKENARKAYEGLTAERERLESKLMQCEHALSETKHALMETREKAKDVRATRRERRERNRWTSRHRRRRRVARG